MNSSQRPTSSARIEQRASSTEQLALLFVSPERLAMHRLPRRCCARVGVRHVRHRRGALHQPLGPRLPSRVPAAPRAREALPRGARCTRTRRRRRPRCARDIAEQLGTARSAACSSATSTGRISPTASLPRIDESTAGHRRDRAPPRRGGHHLLHPPARTSTS